MKLTRLYQGQGFTFLELLVALTLFLVGMVTVLQIFPLNRRLLNQTSQTTNAVFLAQEEIEKVRSNDYTSLPVGTYLARTAVTTDTASPLKIFDKQIVVVQVDTNRATTNTDTGIRRVDVTIFWTETSVQRQYKVSTYVFSPNHSYDSATNAAPGATNAN